MPDPQIDQAYFYYFGCTLRNRVYQMLERFRKPRYIIGLIFVLAYGSFLITRVGFSSPFFLYSIYFYMFFAAWLFLPFGASLTMARALAFKQSELQQLFCAPLSRRRLLQFKLMQSQWSSLIAAVIFTVVTRNIEGTSLIRQFIGLMIFGNIFNLHNSLINILVDFFKRKNVFYLTWFISGGLLAAAGLFVYLVFQQMLSTKVEFSQILTLPIVDPLIEFMEKLLAPALSTSYLIFFHTLWLPLSILAIHLLLYFNVKFPFEDNAIVTAEKLAVLKSRGWSAFRNKQKTVVKNDKHNRLQKLSATGPQWRALVWKNLLSITRIRPGMMRRLCVYMGIVFAIGLFLPPQFQLIASIVLAITAAYTVLLGPALLRVDLRIDIPHFDVIKSMPIHGLQLIFGEIMAPQIVIYTFQVVLTVAAVILIPITPNLALSGIDKIQILIFVLPIFFSLTFFLLTVHNLMALHFPGLVSLGPSMQKGFDQFGQNMVGAVVRVLTLVVALVPVLIVTGIMCGSIYFITSMGLRPLAIIAAYIGSITLLLESLLAIYLSDTRYRHFDLSAENISEEN